MERPAQAYAPVAAGFSTAAWVERAMAQKQKGPGIQSAAGLIRYFDAEEDTNIKIPPISVIFLAIAVGVGVLALRIFV